MDLSKNTSKEKESPNSPNRKDRIRQMFLESSSLVSLQAKSQKQTSEKEKGKTQKRLFPPISSDFTSQPSGSFTRELPEKIQVPQASASIPHAHLGCIAPSNYIPPSSKLDNTQQEALVDTCKEISNETFQAAQNLLFFNRKVVETLSEANYSLEHSRRSLTSKPKTVQSRSNSLDSSLQYDTATPRMTSKSLPPYVIVQPRQSSSSWHILITPRPIPPSPSKDMVKHRKASASPKVLASCPRDRKMTPKNILALRSKPTSSEKASASLLPCKETTSQNSLASPLEVGLPCITNVSGSLFQSKVVQTAQANGPPSRYKVVPPAKALVSLLQYKEAQFPKASVSLQQDKTNIPDTESASRTLHKVTPDFKRHHSLTYKSITSGESSVSPIQPLTTASTLHISPSTKQIGQEKSENRTNESLRKENPEIDKSLL